MVAASAWRQQHPRGDDHSVSIPYHGMIPISAVALLVPLSIFVLSNFFTIQKQKNNNNDSIDIDAMRHLQESCINSTITDEESATTTWAAVKSTSIISSAVAVLCAILYELLRRDPIVGKYVYDRKRLKEPDRTPPPLMLSRSLWHGNDNNDNDRTQKMNCWRVKPAILELLFINLDHKYVRYSKAADDARKAREENGYYTCCRKGWYHNCCFGNKRKLLNNENKDDDLFVDEDGYEYYPGHDYTLDEDVIANRFKTEWSKTINDLFPIDEESSNGCSNVQIDQDSIPDGDLEAIPNTTAESDEALGNKNDTIEDLNLIDSESLNRDDGSETKIAYPYRMVYLFMPPGFHVWGNAFAYMGYFFCCPAITNHFRMLFRRSDPNSGDSVRSHDTISLTEPEQELLRCVGLDIYLLLRFARLGFDATYYPFLVSCVTILPVYYAAAPDSTTRFLSLTINDMENGSRLIWVVVVFSVAFFFYVLRRLWIEWEIFIQLRHNFLAHGARHFRDIDRKQQKYQKTCIVECIPYSHRTDVALFNEFNALFPGQIEQAEMLLETSKLEELVDKRKKLIKRHENIDSLYRYKCWKNRDKKPDEPKIRTGKFCLGERQDEKVYYKEKMLDLDKMIDEEYSKLVEKRGKHCKKSLLSSLHERQWFANSHRNLDGSRNFSISFVQRLFPSKLSALFASSEQFSSDTGVVTFKSIASKQCAVQCNLSDEPNWMITSNAPDPRDIIWANMCMDRQTIELRENLAQFVLLIGLACWGYVVTLITSLSNVLFINEKVGGFLIRVGLTQGYLPALLISLVLLWLPAIFLWMSHKVIRFKSVSRCDEFTLQWSTFYRLANVFFVFFNINLVEVINCFKDSPQAIWLEVSRGIVRQSAFLMNLIILAAGQETMLQLLSWRSVIKQTVKRPWIDVNSKSKRFLDALKEPHFFERSFMFGYYAPTLSYGLMIGMMFGFISPLMLGVCAIYFWIATKVNTHNALFVYRQPNESGGSYFFYWSRVTFITIYCSIVIFAGMLAFKAHYELAIVFVAIMIFIVYRVDCSITNTFVLRSLQLPIKIVAEEVATEEAASLLTEPICYDKEASFMYRNPILDQTWQ